MIRDRKGQAALVRGAEFSDIAPERLEDISASSETLCLTRQHMTSFGRAVPDGATCFTLPAETFDDGHITALTLGDGTLLPADANILGEHVDSLPDMACRLLRAVKLIPAALLSRVSVRNQTQQTRLSLCQPMTPPRSPCCHHMTGTTSHHSRDPACRSNTWRLWGRGGVRDALALGPGLSQ